MMRMTDEKLDAMLSDYCKAEPERVFEFKPDKAEKSAAPILLSRKRRLIAAASLVLVSVLSIAIYFLIGNKIGSPIAVAPVVSGTEATENSSIPAGVYPPDASDGRTDTTVRTPTSPTDSRGTATEPTSPTSSRRSPTTQPSTTAATSQRPTANTTPTQSSALPTEAPVKPTQHPIPPTETTVEPPFELPTIITIEETETPTEGEPELPPQYSLTVEDSVSLDSVYDGVYCKLYNSSGNRLGGANLYDQTHIAYISSVYGDIAVVRYSAPEGLITSPGYYNYVFYDSSGKLLAQGQTYVD